MLRLLWLTTAAAIIAACLADLDFDKCNTTMCNRVGQVLEKNLNFKIHPCDDFREHTCSSRTRGNRPVDVKDVFNDPSLMASNDANIIRSILETPFGAQDSKALEIEKRIFRSCKDYGVRTNADKDHYYKHLTDKAKNLENLNKRPDVNTEHWFGSDKSYAHKGYGYAFFDMRIVDFKDNYNVQAGRYIQIGPPTDNIMDINTLLIKKYDEGNSKSKYFLDLKNFIAELYGIVRQKRTEEEEAKLFQVRDLYSWSEAWTANTQGCDTRIHWKDVVKNLFTMVNEPAPEENFYIIIKDENYFNDLIKLFRNYKNNMITIENYVNLRFISKTIGLVNENYPDYSVIPTLNNLSCVPGLFVATARAYANKYFQKLNQNKLKDVFDAVRRRISTDLGSVNTHMDGNSKELTKDFLRKLNNANIIYAYPKWLFHDTLLENLYPTNMQPNERYFINEEISYKSLQRYNVRALNKPEWPIIDINDLFKAFSTDKIEIFERDSDDIVIPVRAFSESNFDFFSADLYDPMNYASAGTLLATEIYQKWLDTIVGNSNVTSCMGRYLPRGQDMFRPQIDQFKIKATAYLMGLRTAYKEWPNKNSNPIEFNNFGALYDSRLFFYTFAETLCLARSSDQQFLPADYINAVASNMEEFQKTFVCKKDSRMNSTVKCDPLNIDY